MLRTRTRFSGYAIVALCVVATLMPTTMTRAAWQSGGTPICVATGNQDALRTAPDGAGGMLFAWHDFRASSFEVYVQRIDPSGDVLWTIDGVDVDPGGPGQLYADVCSDGAGGAWVVWQQGIISPVSVHVQHFAPDGSLDLFPAGGLVLNAGGAGGDNYRPVCVTDQIGGVIVAWVRDRTGGREVRAQRVDSGGTELWTAGGVVIGSDAEVLAQLDAVANSSTSRGAFVAWTTSLGGGTVQWVDRDGNPRWGPGGDGFGLLRADSRIKVADRQRSSGGVYVAYRYVGSSGFPWGNDRLAVASMDSSTYTFWETVVDTDTIDDRSPGLDPQIMPDGLGGCIVAWDRFAQNGTPAGVYMQRLEPSDGDEEWNGGAPRLVSDVEEGSHAPRMAIDWGVWNSFVTWLGDDDGVSRVMYCMVDRQYGWASTNVLVPGGTSSVRPHIVAEPGGGFDPIVAWEDERRVTETDIYAAGVQPLGEPTAPNLVVRSVSFADDPAEVGEVTNSRIVAENVGSVGSGPFQLAFYHDLSTPPSPRQLPNGPIFDHGGLAPGDSVVFTGDMLSLVETTFRTYAYVDFREAVDEIGHEDDNILGPVLLQWTRRPNLTITSLTLSATEAEIGDAVQATIEITNDGHVAAGAFDLDFYEHAASAPGPATPGDQTHRVPGLAIGETSTWVTAPFTSDEVVISDTWARIDTQNEVGESNEDDNVTGPRSIEWMYPVEDGWPVSLNGMATSPAIATLARGLPGPRHVVLATDAGDVVALDPTGRALPGWPVSTTGSFEAAVAVGDVVAGGGLEVVAVASDGDVYCFSASGERLWSTRLREAVSATPALFDLAGGPGLEVVVGTRDGTLTVLDDRGEDLPGWPISLGAGVGLLASPIVGRLDGASPVIVTIAESTAKAPPQTIIQVLNPDGKSYGPPWPLSLPFAVGGSPVAVDLGAGPELEIAFGDLAGALHVYTLDGATGPFPVSLAGAAIGNLAAWDADGDGDVELVVDTEVSFGGFPSYTLHHAWLVDRDGLVVAGWPASWGHPLHSEACAGGAIAFGHHKNGHLIVGSNRGFCHLLDPTGTEHPVSNWSVPAPVGGTPAVGDLDGDAHLELVIAGDGSVTCIDLLEGSYEPSTLQWPMDRHDPQRTGVYAFGVATETPPVVETRTSHLEVPRPNPFNATVTIPYFVQRRARVAIDVYDLAGRHVANLVDASHEPGRDAVHWHGLDQAGHAVASGVFFTRLQVDGEVVDARRVTLVQ